MVAIDQQSSTESVQRAGIAGCDVHVFPRTADELGPYMPMPWRDQGAPPWLLEVIGQYDGMHRQGSKRCIRTPRLILMRLAIH